MNSPHHFVVIGGGAAGFFAAIAAATANPALKVTILERGKEVLQKVRVSGGGRCNVTHACFDARELVKNYPRGSRELLGPFLRFGPEQTVAWFEERGVRLKTEADGRMFPVTDDSATIVECFERSASNAGVTVRLGQRVENIKPTKDGGWAIKIQGEPNALLADKVLAATGSASAVWDMLQEQGHNIVPPVPSLFTFNTKDTRLRDLSGLSVPHAQLRIPGTKLESNGPLLITHWGLSGPAILRLSAWGARDLQAIDYRFTLAIHWVGDQKPEDLAETLRNIKANVGKKNVQANPQFGLPTRLWQSLCVAADIQEGLRWAEMDKSKLLNLQNQLCAAHFTIAGKSTFKEEFVTAGGVDLREVNFKTFESKLLPGLYFAGEVLNIDAITGGFNFQAAWTGGWVVGNALSTSAQLV